MATDILTAQDAPVTITFKDEVYALPIWTTRELLPVLSRLKAERLAQMEKRMAQFNVPAPQRAYQMYLEDIKPLNPYEAHIYFLSAQGVDECLEGSLKRAGYSPETITKVLAGLRFDQKADLAVRVAGIYEITPTPPAGTSKTPEGVGFGDPGQIAPEQKPGFGEQAAPEPVPAPPAPAAPAAVHPT